MLVNDIQNGTESEEENTVSRFTVCRLRSVSLYPAALRIIFFSCSLTDYQVIAGKTLPQANDTRTSGGKCLHDFNQNRLAVPSDFENIEEQEGQVPVFGSRQPISEGPSRRLSVFTHHGPAS